jgi:ABC-type nickel/cobalt efflux system permease component RcnA
MEQHATLVWNELLVSIAFRAPCGLGSRVLTSVCVCVCVCMSSRERERALTSVKISLEPNACAVNIASCSLHFLRVWGSENREGVSATRAKQEEEEEEEEEEEGTKETKPKRKHTHTHTHTHHMTSTHQQSKNSVCNDLTCLTISLSLSLFVHTGND